jgi:hypothetical protein
MRKVLACGGLGASAALVFLACRGTTGPVSATKSDWEGPAAADGSRNYDIDWSCEPKRYDSSAETTPYKQEEYCEWQTVTPAPAGTPAGKKACMFTTSFDNSRSFYLNSRGATPINSIGAAQALRDDCAHTALKKRQAGQQAGHNCSAIQAQNCVPERNSDPEICDKVRYVVGQNFDKKLNFQIDQMPDDGTDFSPMPLMRLNLLTGLPDGCTYSQPDKTEVICNVDESATCFSMAGQMRPSIRVITTPYSATATASSTTTATTNTTMAPASTTTEGDGSGDGSASLRLTAAAGSTRNPSGSGTDPVVPGDAQPPTLEPNQ